MNPVRFGLERTSYLPEPRRYRNHEHIASKKYTSYKKCRSYTETCWEIRPEVVVGLLIKRVWEAFLEMFKEYWRPSRLCYRTVRHSGKAPILIQMLIIIIYTYILYHLKPRSTRCDGVTILLTFNSLINVSKTVWGTQKILWAKIPGLKCQIFPWGEGMSADVIWGINMIRRKRE